MQHCCLLDSYWRYPTAQLNIFWYCTKSQPSSSSSPNTPHLWKQALKTKFKGPSTLYKEGMGSWWNNLPSWWNNLPTTKSTNLLFVKYSTVHLGEQTLSTNGPNTACVQEAVSFGIELLEGQEASAQERGCPKLALHEHKTSGSLLFFPSINVWLLFQFTLNYLGTMNDSFCVSVITVISSVFYTASVPRELSNYTLLWSSNRDPSLCSENLAGFCRLARVFWEDFWCLAIMYH